MRLSAPVELAEELAAEYPWRFAQDGGPLFRLVPDTTAEGFSITREEGGWRIGFDRTRDALRGLGVAMGSYLATGDVPEQRGSSPFRTLAVMLDTSRNAVMRPEAIASYLRKCALMGIDTLWLYMEDTYRVEGEPMLGYARGAYTPEELRAIDDQAHRLGIEVIPCVQTLGHFEQILQWPAYWPLRDTERVLLAEAAEGYELIDRMIATVASCFRSRRIHIGMDEAHGIGTGQYRRRFGERQPFEILSSHLKNVLAICQEHGLRPMIWSDMYFRLGSAANDYYDPDTEIPSWVAGQIPDEVELVYWDYEHGESAFYADWIERHRRDLGKDPVFAAGGWTHHRLWAALPRALATITAGMTAAREARLPEAVVTMWGNDGTECDLFSALPAVQAFADLAYGSTGHATNFVGSCDATWETWLAAAELDYLPGSGDPVRWRGNPAKWLLWHDPVLGFLTSGLPGWLAGHYRELADRLGATRRGDARLALPALLAEVLAAKVELHRARRAVPGLEEKVRRLRELHRQTWCGDNKPFGWDVIDRRYGGLLARLDHLERFGPEEFEGHDPYPDGALAQCLPYARTASASFIG
ncbi:beta-N-acetylhexosaminidase [Nonomuraea sp. MG754425]|uniref:beta-N-acetylhexosaminidase n=1 Tax=Nonomuraea sp. MG754425 TaxID=2570319 RepID=UPI001F3F7FEC|nr:beta-N-acetylhexosaminidase [Nonomuraea sp. MG754425]MCF6466996.1 beta-N-acetylhexosaminidase [Nonomuraea sp. MG754425]